MREHSSKYRLRSSRTSSWSRASENDVNPTRSPNSTLVRRREATPVADWSRGAAASPRRSAPHSLQNLAPGVTAAPQTGQPWVRVEPHSLQNLAPTGWSTPQRAQVDIRAASGRPEPARDDVLGQAPRLALTRDGVEELLALERQQQRRLHRGDRRGPRDVAQQADLAEVVARTLLAEDLPVRGRDLHPARLDDVEEVGLVALVHDPVAGHHLDPIQDAGEVVEGDRVERREHRDRAEQRQPGGRLETTVQGAHPGVAEYCDQADDHAQDAHCRPESPEV